MSGFVREQLGVNRTRGGEGCSLDALSELLPPRYFTASRVVCLQFRAVDFDCARLSGFVTSIFIDHCCTCIFQCLNKQL